MKQYYHELTIKIGDIEKQGKQIQLIGMNALFLYQAYINSFLFTK